MAFFSAWIERLTAMISLPTFEEQHALNSALRRVKTFPDAYRLRHASLTSEQFPNGKIWWSYPWVANKSNAYIVHANWNYPRRFRGPRPSTSVVRACSGRLAHEVGAKSENLEKAVVSAAILRGSRVLITVLC